MAVGVATRPRSRCPTTGTTAAYHPTHTGAAMLRKLINYLTQEKPVRSLDDEILERAGKSGALAWIIVIGVGLLAVLCATKLFPALFDYTGTLYH